MQQIHGHEVMEMMINSKIAYSEDSLKNAIDEKFGNDARFYVCTAENMTSAELVQCLKGKGKFQPIEGGFTTGRDHVCNH